MSTVITLTSGGAGGDTGGVLGALGIFFGFTDSDIATGRSTSPIGSVSPDTLLGLDIAGIACVENEDTTTTFAVYLHSPGGPPDQNMFESVSFVDSNSVLQTLLTADPDMAFGLAGGFGTDIYVWLWATGNVVSFDDGADHAVTFEQALTVSVYGQFAPASSFPPVLLVNVKGIQPRIYTPLENNIVRARP